MVGIGLGTVGPGMTYAAPGPPASHAAISSPPVSDASASARPPRLLMCAGIVPSNRDGHAHCAAKADASEKADESLHLGTNGDIPGDHSLAADPASKEDRSRQLCVAVGRADESRSVGTRLSIFDTSVVMQQ